MLEAEAVSGSAHPAIPTEPGEEDTLALKQSGYELVSLGLYEQAIVPLEKALHLYNHEMMSKPFLQDSYLVDEVRIRANLLQCYFALTLAKEPADIQTSEEQISRFYEKLLEHLELAGEIYQRFLQRTFQRHTSLPAQKLKSATDSLEHWQ